MAIYCCVLLVCGYKHALSHERNKLYVFEAAAAVTSDATFADTLYGSWFEHVRAWWEMASKDKKIHVVFYEDCKSVGNHLSYISLLCKI